LAGALPQIPLRGGLQRSTDILPGFKGPTSKGKEGRTGGKKKGRGKGMAWKGTGT